MNEPISKIRQYNVEMLRNEFKTITAFSENIQKNKIQVSSWMRDKEPRLIGDVLARDIEVSSGKPEGWLDQIHSKEGFKAWSLKDRAIKVSLEIRKKTLSGSLMSSDMSSIEKIVKNCKNV